jgi:hypothetical protein
VGAVPEVYTTGLRESEEPLLHTRARLPLARTGFLTIVPIGTVIQAIDLARNRLKLQRIRQRAAAVGFPLDRRMAILLTTERILVWRTRTGRAPELLGDIEITDVEAARLPFVGGGNWRLVELQLATGYVVRFQVERTHAPSFVAALNPA